MQLLDGITAAVLGVMVPLMIADITRGTGHFNLGQGIVGTAIGIGASISTDARRLPQRPLRQPHAFFGLAADRVVGLRRASGADAGDPAADEPP